MKKIGTKFLGSINGGVGQDEFAHAVTGTGTFKTGKGLAGFGVVVNVRAGQVMTKGEVDPFAGIGIVGDRAANVYPFAVRGRSCQPPQKHLLVSLVRSFHTL